MSSFINTINHFGSIYRSIIKLNNAPEKCRLISTRMRYTIANFGDDFYKGVSNLVYTVIKLQIECVEIKYQQYRTENLENRIFSYQEYMKSFKLAGHALSYPTLIKAIQCMLYQIETEQLKGVRRMTKQEAIALKFFKDLEYSLLVFCMDNTPEYQQASWSIA